MAPMSYRRGRRRRIEDAAVLRIVARIARVALVILVPVADGYAFYIALQLVACRGRPPELGEGVAYDLGRFYRREAMDHERDEA